jgi:hypothetical protein
MAMTWNEVRELALAWPGMADSTSYGTPSLKVGGKFVLRLREDGETLALRIDVLERTERMAADPAAFFITDHYADYPAVVVRLAHVKRRDLSTLIESAWRDLAPKKLVAAHDAAPSNSSTSRPSNSRPKRRRAPRKPRSTRD